MKVTSQVIETNRVELTLTIDKEMFAEGLDQAFEKVRKELKVDGFRKGQIPRGMFEKRFGVEALYEDALNAVLPKAYEQALDQENLEPVDFPEWEVKEISKDEGVVATAKVWTKPVVELGEYKGLKVEPLSTEVTDEDIQAEIDRLAATKAEMVIKDGPAVDGDIAVIDYEGFKDDVPFDGGKAENHSLELGSGSFIPGFEEQVVGMAAGDEKDINLTFPEEYHAEDLAGADVVFKVKAHEIKTRQLPAIDDEFVKDLDQDGVETVDQLKADIKERLTKNKEVEAKNHLTRSVIEQAVENATFEVPEVMVETEISNGIRMMEQQYQQQGIPFEMYLQFTGQTMEQVREQMKEEAIKRVDQSLVIDAIVTKENIEVTDEDVEAEFAELSEMHNIPVDEIKKMIPDVAMLKQDIQSKKTLDMMVESIV